MVSGDEAPGGGGRNFRAAKVFGTDMRLRPTFWPALDRVPKRGDHGRVRPDGLHALLAFVIALLPGCRSAPERGLPTATVLETRAAQSLEEGRIEEAQALFSAALEQSRPPFLAAVGLARVALRSGDERLFETAMEDALRVAPRTPEAQELCGRTLLEAARASAPPKRRQRALLSATLLGQAQRLAPELPRLAYHTGIAELLAGEAQAAVPLLEIASAEEPEADDVAEAFVEALRAAHREPDIVRVLEARAATRPLSGRLASELERARGRVGRRGDPAAVPK